MDDNENIEIIIKYNVAAFSPYINIQSRSRVILQTQTDLFDESELVKLIGTVILNRMNKFNRDSV